MGCKNGKKRTAVGKLLWSETRRKLEFIFLNGRVCIAWVLPCEPVRLERRAKEQFAARLGISCLRLPVAYLLGLFMNPSFLTSASRRALARCNWKDPLKDKWRGVRKLERTSVRQVAEDCTHCGFEPGRHCSEAHCRVVVRQALLHRQVESFQALVSASSSVSRDA